MIWDHLDNLARAIIDDGSVSFCIHRDGSNWWVHAHHRPKDGKDQYGLAWSAKDSLADAVHDVERQLTKQAEELLGKTQSATRKLEAVLASPPSSETEETKR